MLMRRRGDFLIDYSKPIEQALQDADLPALPYITLRHLPITLQISKAMPGAEQLRDDLDRAYEHLQLEAPATPPAIPASQKVLYGDRPFAPERTREIIAKFAAR